MELLLQQNELLTIDTDIRGCTIRIQGGLLWLTQEGDSRDHILRAGERFTVTRKGRIVLLAARDSVCALHNEKVRHPFSVPVQVGAR